MVLRYVTKLEFAVSMTDVQQDPHTSILFLLAVHVASREPRCIVPAHAFNGLQLRIQPGGLDS